MVLRGHQQPMAIGGDHAPGARWTGAHARSQADHQGRSHLARAGREQMRILVERSERRDDIHGRLVRRTTDGRIKA